MEILGLDAPLLGFAIVAAVFAIFAGLELAAPFRRGSQPRMHRWRTNLALFALDTALVRLAIPLLMIGMAQVAEERGWGLFNQLDLPVWLEFLAAILLLDLALYFQHWATHRVPLLWRLHKVHHADPDFDISTGARFHPVEIVLSMLYKMSVVALIGPLALAVFVFEVVFNLATIFTHANIALSARAEPGVRAVLVTPDMHRVHHSVVKGETNSNYGTMLSGWDRLFGTYVAQPGEGRQGLTIGLKEFQDPRPNRLGWSLRLPFMSQEGVASAPERTGPDQPGS